MNINLMLLRKSRSDSAKETVEETLARHEQQLQELAIEQTGEPIKEENIYREVVSGGEDIKSRPDFMRLLKRLEKNNVHQVYCMDPERLSRSGMYGAGDVLRIFEITDTLIATYDQTYDLKKPMDKKYLEMRMIQSAEYRNYSKDTMNRGRRRSVKEGYFVGSSSPFGYKKKQLPDEKNRFILEPDENEAPTVKLMFNMILEGVGTSNLANYLNEYKYKPRKNKFWTVAMVRNIITSKVYIGINTWGKYKQIEEVVNGEVVKRRKKQEEYEEFKGRQEHLISEEVFYKVQDILKSHPSSKSGKNKKSANSLAGIIICKKCGRHMIRRPYTEKHVKNGHRRYKYDRQELLDYLRAAKDKSGLSLSQIAKQVNVSRETVYTWFPPRLDKFSDSSYLAKHWFKLKEILGIEDDKFDKQVTTYTKTKQQKDSLICVTPFCDNVSSELEIVEKRLLKSIEIKLNEFNFFVDNYEEVIKKEKKSNEKILVKIDKELEKLKKELKNLRRAYNREEFTFEEYVEDKKDIEEEIEELEDTKNKILTKNDKDKLEQIERRKKAIPVLTRCLNDYYKLSIKERNELLKDIFQKVEYEKNEGGRWIKEAIDKFNLDIHLNVQI